MKEKNILELIDEFLLGRIQPNDLNRLEYLRRTNPEIDLQVLQSIEAFRVLQYARYQQLRQKLHQIDATSTKPLPWILQNRWYIGGALLIFSFLGLWMGTVKYFSPASLAARHVEQTLPAFSGPEKIRNENVKNWELACGAFMRGDHRRAIILFQPFLENTESRVVQYAYWNILLARFAIEGPGQSWREEINQFESAAPQEIKTKIKAFVQTIDSPFYKIIVLKFSLKLSAFKPNLI